MVPAIALSVPLGTSHVGVSSDGLSILILGIALVVAALIAFRLLPKLNDIIEKTLFGGRRLAGRGFRAVAGPIFLGIFGVLGIVTGIVKLLEGH